MIPTEMIDTVLLPPAAVWSAIDVKAILEDCLYGYTSPWPFPFRMHTLSLPNIAVFYVITFLLVRPHRPVKNLAIALSLIFLFNAVYELVFGGQSVNAINTRASTST